jgi:hypothetical protein
LAHARFARAATGNAFKLLLETLNKYLPFGLSRELVERSKPLI